MRSNRTLRFFNFYIKRMYQLTGREKIVLIGRLKFKTLEGVGKSLNLTEARIRQIERAAISKIKNKEKQLVLFKRD